MKKLQLLSGTWGKGNGIIVADEGFKNMYHLLCIEDYETGELFAWLGDEKIHENDIEMK